MLLKRKPKNLAKNLSAALQAVNDPLENQLGYMNSNRPSMPNLSNAPKPSKLLTPTRLHQTVSSLAFRIPQLAHCINQYELVLSWTASQTPRTFLLLWIWWGKDLFLWSSHGYDNGESGSRGIWRIKCIRLWINKCIRLWINQSCFFSRVFLLKFSLEALYISWV